MLLNAIRNNARHRVWSVVTEPIPGGKGTYFSVDILRGLAALSILIFHYHFFFRRGPELSMPIEGLRANPAVDFFWPLFQKGWLAVMLFWTISGFVFMHVYAGRHIKTTMGEFAINRIARLYPLHIGTLLLVAALQAFSMDMFGNYTIYQTNDFFHFVLNIFMASEWGLQDGRSFNGPFWSVSVEILIYAAFFIFIKNFPISLFSLSLAVIAFLSLTILTSSNIAFCGVYFFMGALAYGVMKSILALGNKKALTLATSALALWICFREIAHFAGFNIPMTINLGLLFALLVIFLGSLETAFNAGWLKKFRILGDITYATYLIHTPIIMMFHLANRAGWVKIDVVYEVWFFVAYMVFVCGVSWLVFKYFERPAQRYIRNAYRSFIERKSGLPIKAVQPAE